MGTDSKKKLKELNIIFNQMDELYHKTAVSLELSDSGFEILNAISILGEGVTQTDIYKNSCLNKQTVNSSIKQLEKKNIIYFQKEKKKEYQIYLTASGKQFITEKILPFAQVDEQVLAEMSEDEYQTLLKLMKKYYTIYKNKLTIYIKSLNDK